ncbi:MAG: response regulator [Thermodesulfobacteriota bacterium]
MDKVLIVEDDPNLLERLREELKKYVGQFETLTAANGAEALEVLKKERISVLITDLDMPRMNGMELLAHMRRHHPQVPCVVMTETENPEISTRAATDSVLGCIPKPVDANMLFTLIMEGLERLDEGMFWRKHRNK